MKFDIVVAHYKENLDWLSELDVPLVNNVYVYTKSDLEVPKLPKIRHSYLTNVGRESHTYIWHCIHNWDAISSLSDFTFFVQGSPHDMGGRRINEWMDLVSSEGLDHTYNFRVCSPNEFLNAGRCTEWAGKTKPSDCPVMDWCRRHVKEKPSESIPIFWNACFGVSNRLIASSRLSRYVNIAQNELNDINPECGHYCERLWYYIFNMDMSNKKILSASYVFSGGHDGKKHHGMLRLKDDGTIGIYSHFNERFWTSENDSITLYDAKRKPTSVLQKIGEGEYLGTFLGDQNIKHRLKLFTDSFWNS